MLSLISALLLAGCDLDVSTGAQLATLTTAAQRDAYRFELSVQDGVLKIRMVSDTGVALSREVAATGTCEDDAMVAAVVLSAWMTHPDPARSPRGVAKPAQHPAPARAAPARLAAASSVEPGPVPPVEPETVTPAVQQQEDTDTPDLPSVSRARVSARWTWSASLEVGAVIGGGGAPALTLRAEGGGRLGVVADFTAAMERDLAVAPGTIHWAREFGSIGARARWRPEKRWLVDVSVSVAAGWVFARGAGVTQAAGSGRVDGGACGGVVVGGYELGPFGMFLSARACGWPWAPRIALQGVDQPLELPVLEAVMGVGVMWGGSGG